MKIIKIYSGNNIKGINGKLFEEHLFYDKQVGKAIKTVKEFIEGEKIIWTNSVFVAEALNKYGKAEGCKIKFYMDNKEIEPAEYFALCSKPFEDLVFYDSNK